MHITLKLMASALLAASVLTACGGGGGGGDEVVTPAPPAATGVVPDEARLSSEAFTAWMRTLQAAETTEPLSMGGLVTAPASDTADPASLN